MIRPIRKSPWILLLVLAGCAEGSRDSSIFGGSAPTSMGDTDDDSGGEGMNGDGDPTTGDGDGDPTTGDGDGDPTTGDGDGDGDPTGDGDGDGDPTTGDGDGDPTTDGQPCGNGVIDPGEECDGGNLGGSSCAAQGFDGGTLTCDPIVCVFDTSGCTNNPGNMCNNFCNGCTCPSFECTMCCANKGQVDVCGGGMCGCF